MANYVLLCIVLLQTLDCAALRHYSISVQTMRKKSTRIAQRSLNKCKSGLYLVHEMFILTYHVTRRMTSEIKHRGMDKNREQPKYRRISFRSIFQIM